MYRRNMFNILEKTLVFYSPGKLPLILRKERDTTTLFLEVTEREFSFLIKTQETASACYFVNAFSPTGVNQVHRGNA